MTSSADLFGTPCVVTGGLLKATASVDVILLLVQAAKHSNKTVIAIVDFTIFLIYQAFNPNKKRNWHTEPEAV